MATAFAEIYARFSNKITDYVLMELSDEDAVEIMYGYLISAVSKLRDVRDGAFAYTDEDTIEDEDGEEVLIGPHFLAELSDTEKELLTLGMMQEWMEPRIQNVLNTNQFISSKETNFYSQRTHFEGLLDMQKKIKLDKDHLLTQYKVLHNDYLGTSERLG